MKIVGKNTEYDHLSTQSQKILILHKENNIFYGEKLQTIIES